MKKILIPVIALALVSCNDAPKFDPNAGFEINNTIENVSAVSFEWDWSSSGPRKVETKFEVSSSNLGGSATVFELTNNTGSISDVFTYSNGNPDLDPAKRAWVLEYSGDAKSVNVNWKANLQQIGIRDTTSTVEVVFQVYAVIPSALIEILEEDDEEDDEEGITVDEWLKFGIWRDYQNNIRPQVGIDTLFLGFDEDKIETLRNQARDRMIARYYNTSVFKHDEYKEVGENKVWSIDIERDGEYFFPPLPPIQPETPKAKYFMQLFLRIYSNNNKSAEYIIKNGELNINFVY